MGIKSIDYDLCTGCGQCDLSCSMDVIRFNRERSAPEIIYPRDCMACFLCVVNCPAKAITVTLQREQPMPMPY